MHASNADLPHVDTEFALYRTVLSALQADDVAKVAVVSWPDLPADVPVLYPEMLRGVLSDLVSVVDCMRGYLEATSPATRGRHLLEAQDAVANIGPAVENVPEAEILARTGASAEATGAALRSLKSHDVIVAVDEADLRGWRCTVELMRRWLGRLGNGPTPAAPAARDG